MYLLTDIVKVGVTVFVIGALFVFVLMACLMAIQDDN